jgi:hypothetical protein
MSQVLRLRYGHARNPQWTVFSPLAKAQVLGGIYLKHANGNVVIFARRYLSGGTGDRHYRIAYSTVRYTAGDSRTGGAHETLYEGQSLAKAKAVVS